MASPGCSMDVGSGITKTAVAAKT
ncbi:hypothetical protein SBA5_1340002 [Candidatus Sulfotelmatomonas gaucii]|uniref:Uncharacterized protein n=1 Tax=Candidatus Sulfuritelmatomonas gaucii TaxID=2043161 RepID=A0A2N9L4F3_9BACT|nr:hypothetical protein SBA5_1340002 [Candidatus Sulfotelmatomonas gaucii]